ncbi:hypothetical protein [Maritalea sp.]|uniref:hypothetical protein n=1 Tax=Maritalea sp. TaxID=2003361 RepID=UPI003EF08D25
MDRHFVSGTWPVGAALDWYVSGRGQSVSINPNGGIYRDLKLSTLINDFQGEFENLAVGGSFEFGGGFGGAHAESINHARINLTVNDVLSANNDLKFVSFSINSVVDTYDFNLDQLGPDILSGNLGNMPRHAGTLGGEVLAILLARQDIQNGNFSVPQQYDISVGSSTENYMLMVPRSAQHSPGKANLGFADNVNAGVFQMLGAMGPGARFGDNINKCFSADTSIQLSNGTLIEIENIRVGDQVASYSESVSNGREALSSKSVVHLFENVTDIWIELSNGLTVTPGHHFLASDGSFKAIDDILGADGIVIDEVGNELKVTGEYIRYSEDTAGLYEQAEMYVAASAGSLALQPELKKGWKTYNFEVEDFHTYVAGGIRVHNMSVDFANKYDGTPVYPHMIPRHNPDTNEFENAVIWKPDPASAENQSAALKHLMEQDHDPITIPGDGPATTIASGKTVNAGTKIVANDYVYTVNGDGSITNMTTGRTTSPPTTPGSTSPVGGTQVTGSGPKVTLGTGKEVNSGTTVSQNGYDYVVNADGSTTNTTTGWTYNKDGTRSQSDSDKQSSSSNNDGGGKSSQSSSSSSRDNDSDKDSNSSSGGYDYFDAADGVWKTKPVIFDLDGDGIEIAQLNASNFFYDINGDGKDNRTAWAAAGDGVLVRDEGNDGVIELKQEIDFTSWAPSARSDLEALRMAFDSNGDGKLDAQDDDWSLFKILVTNDDGTTTLKTLAELGITSLDLISNNHQQTLSDGSNIAGTTTFTKSDGTTGVAGDVALSYDTGSYVVTQTTTNNADGSTTIENTGRRTDGSIAHNTVSTISADGNTRTISFDDDGDGVADRVRSESRVLNADGSIVETFDDFDTSETILLRREQKETSADKNTITISTDANGSGVFDVVETRTTAANGDLTVVIENRNADGSMHDRQSTTTSADGLSKTVQVELTATGGINGTKTVDTNVAADGTRTETITNYSGDGVTLAHKTSSIKTTISGDGKSRTVETDLDGDGDVDITSSSVITNNVDGSKSTTDTISNGDGSLRSMTVKSLSADGNTKTAEVDIDGDGVFDQKTVDATVVNGDGSRERTVTTTNGDQSLSSKFVESASADGKTRTISVDSDGDGNFDQIQTIVEVNGNLVDTISTYAPNGGILVNRVETTTSADGLTQTTKSDINGDGTYDTIVETTKIQLVDGGSRVTTETKNGDGTVEISKSEVTTSADGLTKYGATYANGGALPEYSFADVTGKNADGSITQVVEKHVGGAPDSTRVGPTVTEISADKLTVITKQFVEDFTDPASISTTVKSVDGSIVQTVESFSPDGTILVGKSVSEISADGLTSVTKSDANGDGTFDTILRTVKTLNDDGSVTTTQTSYAGNVETAANKNGSSVSTVSGNQLNKTTYSDADGDGQFDSKTVEQTVLNVDGSRTTTATSYNGDGTVQTGKSIATVSDDGLTKTSSVFYGADGTADLTTSQVTTLAADGSTTVTTSNFAADGSLASKSVVMSSGDGLSSSNSIDRNGDGVDDQKAVTTKNIDGSVTTEVTTYDTSGVLVSKSVQNTAANGLSSTVTNDTDGNGVTDSSTSTLTTLNADGSTIKVYSKFDVAGALLEKSTTTTSADGRTSNTTWDDAGGNSTRSQSSVLVINADGSQTNTFTEFNADGSVHDKTITQTSANGLEIHTSRDVDGDATTDQSFVQQTLGDGTIRTSKMDGVVQTASGREFGDAGGQYTTTSADGTLITIQYDSDGDGLAETQTTTLTQLNADGTTVQTVTNSSLTGGDSNAAEPVYVEATNNKTMVTTSADGRTITTQWDLDGNGTVDEHRIEDTTFAVDGSSTTLVSLFNDGVLTSKVETTKSADRTTTTIKRDSDGSGSFDEIAEKSVATNTDGSLTETTTVTNPNGSLISKTSIHTSVDGLTVTTELDPKGTGSYTEKSVSVRETFADGTDKTTKSKYDANDVLTEASVVQNNFDGSRTDISIDANGDGNTNQTKIVEASIDGSSKITKTNFDQNGVVQEVLISERSSDGLLLTTEKDENGDGVVDQTTSHTWLTNADGSREEVLEVYKVSETASDGSVSSISPVLQNKAVIKTNADGRTKVSEVDVDGDGNADEVTTTINNIDGSITTETTANAVARAVPTDSNEIRWASAVATGNPTVAAATKTTIRADGITRIVEADYDGNGTFEHKEVWKRGLDGSQIAAITDVDANGDVVASGTYTVSADGRVRTMLSDATNGGFPDTYQTWVTRIDRQDAKTTQNVADGISVPIVLVTAIGDKLAYNITGTDNNDYIIGGVLADTISGGAGDDKIDGGSGADQLFGNAGNDIFIGGDGADQIDGGDGVDLVDYSLSSDGVSVNLLAGSGSGGDAAGDSFANIESVKGSLFGDTLTGDGNSNYLDGQDGNDVVHGGAGNDVLLGGTGNDQLNGDAGADQLSGQSGNDFLDGGAGGDQMDGGTGDDTYIVDNIGDLVSEIADEGHDLVKASINYTLTANVDDLILTGTGNLNGTGNSLGNKIIGTSGNNVLSGQAGDDILVGGLGSDQLVGGDGHDIASYERATSGVFVHTGWESQNTGEAAGDTYSSIEGLIGSQFDDEMILVADGATMEGGAGNDKLTAVGSHANISGGAGDDDIYGTDGADVLDGGDGIDSIFGKNGHDNIKAGAGNDYVKAGSGKDIVDAGAGDDVVEGNGGADILIGGAGADDLKGGGGFDIASYETAQTGVVIDTSHMSSATGDAAGDWYQSIQGIKGSNHDDQITTAWNNAKLYGGAGDDTLTIAGSAGELHGDSGNDILTSGAGNNRIDGGTGADQMSGGAHNDTYVVDNAGDTVIEAHNDGYDKVEASVSHTLADNVEDLILTGTNAINGTGNDTVNTITGNDNNNILDGGIGADLLVGGMGNDTYIVDNAGDDITEHASEGADKVVSSVDYALGNNVENLDLTGSALNATGNSLANTIQGNALNNVIVGGVGNDQLTGGLGDDRFEFNVGDGSDSVLDFTVHNGTTNGDLIKIRGIAFADFTEFLTKASDVNGDVQIDLNQTGLGNGDLITLKNVTVSQLSEDDFDITITPADQTLIGDAGNNTLTGDVGNDTLIGNGGADVLDGGAGFDVASYETASSGIYLHTGVANSGTGDAAGDTYTSIEGFKGSSHNDEFIFVEDQVFVWGGAGDDTITLDGNGGTADGEDGADTIYGSQGDDVLKGGAGDDSLHAWSGNDTVEGGAGDDWLVLEGGNDTIIFKSGDGWDGVSDFQTHNGGANGDVIEVHGQTASNFAQLIANATEWNGDTYINLDNSEGMTLHGVSLSDLTSDDFNFIV